MRLQTRIAHSPHLPRASAGSAAGAAAKAAEMLAGVKQQCGEPAEIKELEQQIAKTQEELSTLIGV